MGIIPNFDSIILKPLLPSKWNEVEVFRIYQGAKYSIKLIRSNEEKLIIDGKEYEGNVIPLINDDKIHEVIYYFR